MQQADGMPLPAAAECFGTGLDLARQQDALYWELRLALGLAGLRLKQNRPQEARQVLAPVCARFPEGLDTTDLDAACAVLRAIESS
jgi:predicted ATPase